MSESPFDDKLSIPEVGAWSKRKYHFLGRYLDAFTTAMKDKWSELHYVDLFTGAGIARLKSNDELVYSSALLAARLKYPFTQLHLCDAESKNTDALAKRLETYSFKFEKPPKIHTGDANALIDTILREVPERKALCVTFADPFGLHLDFETVKKIANKKSDLIVLIADNMDAVRNWAAYYRDNPDSNLDKFMGEDGWRKKFEENPDKVACVLRDRYKERLGSLSYKHFEQIRVQNQSDRDIYTLLFASKHEAGAKIWRGIASKDEGGQMSLYYRS